MTEDEILKDEDFTIVEEKARAPFIFKTKEFIAPIHSKKKLRDGKRKVTDMAVVFRMIRKHDS